MIRVSASPTDFKNSPGISRRDFLRTATFFAGALLTGCRSENVSGARVTLKQWYHQYGEAGTQQAALRYAAEYTKLNPDVAVKMVWVPGDYQTKVNTALLTSGGPDVFEKQLTIPMVSAGQVEPLDDLFPPEIKADYLPDDLALNTVDGKIYGVKMVDDFGLFYYRTSLLAAAGLKPPASFDELIAVGKALTTSQQKGLYLGNDGGVGAALLQMPWSAGQQVVVNDQVAFNTPRTAEAYARLRDLTGSNCLLIGAPTDWWDPTALVQGMAAMQWCGIWAYPAIHRAFGEDLGCIPWPALDSNGRPSTFFGGWSQMVNAKSRHVDEAKRFVRWLWIENKEIQRDWNVNYGFHIPPRQSVAKETPALNDRIPAQAIGFLRDYANALPPTWSSSMQTALNDAVANIIKKGRSAADEVATAARKCERELKRLLRYREK
jgi:multiple sugar transport system substrate-binding protein